MLPAGHCFSSLDAWLGSLGTNELDVSLPDLTSFITRCLPCETAIFLHWKHSPHQRGGIVPVRTSHSRKESGDGLAKGQIVPGKINVWLKPRKHPFSITAQQHPKKQTSPACWVPSQGAQKTTAHLPCPDPVSTLQKHRMLSLFPGRTPRQCQLKSPCPGRLDPHIPSHHSTETAPAPAAHSGIWHAASALQ